MRRAREQSGYIYKRGGWWVLRYRENVLEGGVRKRRQRAKSVIQLALTGREKPLHSLQEKVRRKRLRQIGLPPPSNWMIRSGFRERRAGSNRRRLSQQRCRSKRFEHVIYPDAQRAQGVKRPERAKRLHES